MVKKDFIRSSKNYLLDLRARWLSFPPIVVIISPGPPDEGFVSCCLYGCDLDKCEFSNITCNECSHCLGFYTDTIVNNIFVHSF